MKSNLEKILDYLKSIPIQEAREATKYVLNKDDYVADGLDEFEIDELNTKDNN